MQNLQLLLSKYLLVPVCIYPCKHLPQFRRKSTQYPHVSCLKPRLARPLRFKVAFRTATRLPTGSNARTFKHRCRGFPANQSGQPIRPQLLQEARHVFKAATASESNLSGPASQRSISCGEVSLFAPQAYHSNWPVSSCRLICITR